MNSQSNNEMIPLDTVHEISVKELAEFRKFKKTKESVQKSEIFNVVSARNDVATISFIERELALTIARLDADIDERTACGKSSFEQNMRKIRALKNLSELIFNKRQIALNEAINLKSESFGRVFEEILNLVRTSATEAGVPDYHINSLFEKLGQNLKGWEEQAQKKLSANPGNG